MSLRFCKSEQRLTPHTRAGMSAQGRSEFSCDYCGETSGLSITEINEIKETQKKRRAEDKQLNEDLKDITQI